MRVIVIADFAVATGGAQRVAVESARALAEAGAQVTFIHAVAGTDPALDHPSIDKVCLDLPDIWSRGALSAAVNGVWNRKAAKRMAAALAPYARVRDTVAHLHQWTRAFSPSILAPLRASGLPLAVTAHDYFLACPNGVLYRFDKSEPCALKPMGAACLVANCDTRSYPHKLVRVARQYAAMSQRRGGRVDVIHIADGARDRLAPMLPAAWRHHRVDNPIAVARGPAAVIANDAVFATVGRLTDDKGALVAADAAARAGAKMLFIGEGPAREEILRLHPSAEITGWVAPGEVETLLRTRVRAVLAPSLWPETGPLTVLEAAAMGIPAIASSRCGASEHLGAGSGRVANPDPASFALAMRDLSDNETARTMGKAAYERFWAKPRDPAAHAAGLLDVYRGMLS